MKRPLSHWTCLGQILLLFVFTASLSYAEEEVVVEASDVDSDSSSSGQSEQNIESVNGLDSERLFNAYYYAVLNGPALEDPSIYQPRLDGEKDLDRPVVLKNYLSVGYNFTDAISVAGTAFWTWQPGPGKQFILRDPFVRVSHNSLVSFGNLNLYADLRVHFPVTTLSRESDLLAGFQTFQVLSYEFPEAKLLVGLYGSARTNIFGKQGVGNDWEFYLAPNINYQALPNLAVNLVYEMGASHAFRDRTFHYTSDGTDLQPGVTWDVTPYLTLNPYLNLLPSDGIKLKNTSLGFFVSWKII